MKTVKLEYESQDWFRVYDANGELYFVGHPEDFWYEFDYHAPKLGWKVLVVHP